MLEKNEVSRKGFLRTTLAYGGLILSYGTLGGIVLNYLWPSRQKVQQKIFVAHSKNLAPGQTMTFSTPSGENYLLSSRQVEDKTEFFAFSNRCPHLGCKVLWESDKSRFHCPCHGGIFNDNGVATAGPPAKAKQSLKKCELNIVDGAIYAVVNQS